MTSSADTHVRKAPLPRMVAAALMTLTTLLALTLQGAALAQGNDEAGADQPPAVEATNGTQIILPDGSRCLPLSAAEGASVAGAQLEYLCREGGQLGLVGGVIESGGQLSLEVVEADGSHDTVEDSRLALFAVSSLLLANGAVCTPGSEATAQGDDRPVTYDCVTESGEAFVVLGDLEQSDQGGYATSFVTTAQLADNGQVADTARVAVRVIDGTLPFTKVRWVLASWGTGQAPPISGSAPTLEFSEGRIGGNSGCNSYFAPATILSEGQMLLGPAGSTLMACSEELMQQEFRYLAALDGVTGYEWFGGNLYLYGGAEVITFEPAAD